MPAQFTGTNGASARRLDAPIARATSSLPTPLSPVIRTLPSERATCSISSFSSIIAGLEPSKLTFPFCLMSLQFQRGRQTFSGDSVDVSPLVQDDHQPTWR